MSTKSWATRVAALSVTSLVATGVLIAVSAAPAHAVATPTVTTLSSSKNPSTACSQVTFTATVSEALFSPLGGVQFFDGASPLGGPQILSPDFGSFLGVPTPTDHSSASVTVTLSGGTHVITSVYAGDDLPSGGGPLTQHVNAPTSTTTVTSSVNPSVYGQSVNFVAAVTSSCGGSVPGSVQFTADGANLGDPQPVDNGKASVSTSTLGVGTHPIQAVFTSTDGTVGSTGTLTAGQVVQPADTTTTVASSANPSEYGANVSFTSTTSANAPGAGTPTGSAQFQDTGANIGGPKTLNAGQASVSTSSLTVGSHTISAAYSSDSPNFNGSNGSVNQVVNKARTTLTYDGATTAKYDDPATLSARLTRTDNGDALAGASVTLSMASESCTTLTDSSGEAACSITPSEPAGTYTASASYAGDANYLASSTSAPFTVTKQVTTTTYTGPTVIAQGGPVTLSGQLLEKGVKPIVGRSITLTLGTGPSAQSCVATPTDSAGNAHCTVSNVAVGQGSEPVRADFAGDAYYLPSFDASQSAIVFAFPSRGIFLVGDRSAASTPSNVTFWGAQWAKSNVLSGNSASSFKGFADQVTTTPPSCGSTWTSSSGNSSNPVSTVPAYMGVAVTTKVATSGSNLSGVITHIVVVRTNPGYGSDPGHAGTGAIVATYC